MDILDLVNKFNNGEEDFVEDYFGTYENFFKFLNKRKSLHLIDTSSYGSDKWENQFLLILLETDKESFIKIISDGYMLNGIEFLNGHPYITVSSPAAFSDLFCRDRNTTPEFIETILNGDSDRYYDIPCDIYDDVINELNPDNLSLLKKYMINNLKDVEIYPEGDLLWSISNSQNNDFVAISESNIDEILGDKLSSKYIIENYLPDLDNNLWMIYSSSYNDAHTYEVQDEVYNKLSDYFYINGEWTSRGYYRTGIVDFFDYIKFFLKENLNYTNTLSHYGDYISILKEVIECIKYYPPDYPDYSLIKKYVNDMFPEYIY